MYIAEGIKRSAKCSVYLVYTQKLYNTDSCQYPFSILNDNRFMTKKITIELRRYGVFIPTRKRKGL